MCLSHQDASFHMHDDLLRSPLDLDLRSNFAIDLLRSTSIPFDAPRQEKHNDISMITLALIAEKLLQKNCSLKTQHLFLFCISGD